MIAPEAFAGGLTDPVFQSQDVFRRLLDALARPGTVVAIPAVVVAPAPLNAAAAALLATLADEETPVYFDDCPGASPAAAWVRFQTGCPLADAPANASFAVVTSAGAPLAIERLAPGTQDYPDRSTTLILQVDDLSDGERFRLEGPGIDGATEASVRPAPPNLVEALTRNRALFPRGVDVFVAAPDAILALPRTTRVTHLEGA